MDFSIIIRIKFLLLLIEYLKVNNLLSNPETNINERFMRQAIDQAFIAEDNGDVPIGCVIVYENKVIAKGYNQREQLNDPTAHAEMIALTASA